MGDRKIDLTRRGFARKYIFMYLKFYLYSYTSTNRVNHALIIPLQNASWGDWRFLQTLIIGISEYRRFNNNYKNVQTNKLQNYWSVDSTSISLFHQIQSSDLIFRLYMRQITFCTNSPPKYSMFLKINYQP